MTAPIHITRKAIKHLYLRIDRDGRLQISAPKRMPTAEIMAFVEQKQHWIADKQHQRAKADNAKTINDSHLMLFGQHHPIQRQYQQPRNRLTVDNGVCQLALQAHDAADGEVYENKLITEFYRAQLTPILHDLVARYRPIIGVNPAEIRTKNMKTKWGTCNTQAARLWFNVQLARFSQGHIEYVVVHEMVHLLEPSHNRRFYQLVAQAMPDWEGYHQALKQAD